jgi:ubiquinone/menaquinone biosynthesis C-methylase UbiE
MQDLRGRRAIDVGCGEGKNAVFLRKLGMEVTALDVSSVALANASNAWPADEGVTWRRADIRDIELEDEAFDLVVAYGLLHCMVDEKEVVSVVENLKRATKRGGIQILCAFNSRHQDLRAHPGFSPTLLSHQQYLDMYSEWEVLLGTDTDLWESHPHNQLEHVHSLTRLILRRQTVENRDLEREVLNVHSS